MANDQKPKPDLEDVRRRTRRVVIVMGIWLGLLFGFVYGVPDEVVAKWFGGTPSATPK